MICMGISTLMWFITQAGPGPDMCMPGAARQWLPCELDVDPLVLSQKLANLVAPAGNSVLEHMTGTSGGVPRMPTSLSSGFSPGWAMCVAEGMLDAQATASWSTSWAPAAARWRCSPATAPP